MTEEFKDAPWIRLNEDGLREFRRRPGWDATLRAAYLGVSDKYPELIKVMVRGEDRVREVHPKYWKPAP